MSDLYENLKHRKTEKYCSGLFTVIKFVVDNDQYIRFSVCQPARFYNVVKSVTPILILMFYIIRVASPEFYFHCV